MPSFTFVSTANAFVAARRGARVRRHPRRTRSTSTSAWSRRPSRRARGRSCRSTTPASAARWTRIVRARAAPRAARHRGRGAGHLRGLPRGAPLGSDRPPRRALSFHETKNVICGEGGALLVNDPALRRARRDRPREGHEPQRASSAARSTSTRGSTSARRSCLSEHGGRLPVGAARGGRADHRAAAADLAALPRRRSRRSSAAGRLRRPVVPATAPQRAPLLPAAGATATDREPLHRAPRAPTGIARSSTTCRCTPRRRAGATAARIGDAAGRPTSVAERLRPAAAVGGHDRRRHRPRRRVHPRRPVESAQPRPRLVAARAGRPVGASRDLHEELGSVLAQLPQKGIGCVGQANECAALLAPGRRDRFRRASIAAHAPRRSARGPREI